MGDKKLRIKMVTFFEAEIDSSERVIDIFNRNILQIIDNAQIVSMIEVNENE